MNSEESKKEIRNKVGKIHRQLEDTLKFVIYYYLMTDMKFKRDFLLWAGFNDLAKDDNVMVYVERQNEESKVIHDIYFQSLNTNIVKTVELKVWTKLTDDQNKHLNTIDLIIAPEIMFKPEWASKAKTWIELRDHFQGKQDYFKHIGDLFTTGDTPKSSDILNEIKGWTNNNTFPVRTAYFLDKICYYAGNIDLRIKAEPSKWKCQNNWSSSRQERYFSFYYKNGDQELYAGLFWDKDYCKLGFKIDVSNSLQRKSVGNVPSWYEFHKGHMRLYTTILCDEITDITLDAKELAEKIQSKASEIDVSLGAGNE